MGLLSWLPWLKRSRYDELREQIDTAMNELKSEIAQLKIEVQEAKLRAEGASINSEKALSKTASLEEELNAMAENIERVLKLAKYGVEAKKEVDALKRELSDTQAKTKRKRVERIAEFHDDSYPQAFLNNLSRAEKSIINVLLNADMPLSYEDIAKALGKSESTVRDHIASIRRKSNILEVVESAERKKLFRIPVKLKNHILH